MVNGELTSEQMDQITAGQLSLSNFAAAIGVALTSETTADNINQNVNAIAINLGDDDDDFPPGQGGG